MPKKRSEVKLKYHYPQHTSPAGSSSKMELVFHKKSCRIGLERLTKYFESGVKGISLQVWKKRWLCAPSSLQGRKLTAAGQLPAALRQWRESTCCRISQGKTLEEWSSLSVRAVISFPCTSPWCSYKQLLCRVLSALGKVCCNLRPVPITRALPPCSSFRGQVTPSLFQFSSPGLVSLPQQSRFTFHTLHFGRANQPQSDTSTSHCPSKPHHPEPRNNPLVLFS